MFELLSLEQETVQIISSVQKCAVLAVGFVTRMYDLSFTTSVIFYIQLLTETADQLTRYDGGGEV
jgi:hypothetical protein